MVRREGIWGAPAVVARRKRIWVSGVGLEGVFEGGRRWAAHKDLLGLIAMAVLRRMIFPRDGSTQLPLAGRPRQRRRLRGRH